MLLILTVLTLVVTCTAGKTRTWLSNTNFDNPANWEGNKLPCSTSNVIFPLKHKMPVQLGKELQIHSLFLSDNGALLLPKNGKITFTSETKDSSCGGGDIRFTRRKQRYWIDPENWSGSNAATPHLERVPCFDDELIFPENHSFYVGLPRFFSNAASVTIDGQKLVGWNWKKFLNDKIGRRTFQPHLAPLAVYNYPCPQNDDCDCHIITYDEEICPLMKVENAEEDCHFPVLPFGFCNSICGKDLNKVGEVMQTAVDVVAVRAEEAGFRFSATKTVCVHFCRLRREHTPPRICLGGVPIRGVESVKFLDFLFDEK